MVLSIFWALLFVSSAYGGSLSLNVKEFSCKEDGYSVKFGVINSYTYGRNPTLAFKVVEGEQVLACETITLNVPAGSDGSDLHEVTFNLRCEDKQLNLQYRIFERRAANRVGVWLEDCPK